MYAYAHAAETHGAVLIDAPTSYHADSVSLTVLPSFRLSDSSGYSTLASDYPRISASGAEIDSERNAFTLTGQVARRLQPVLQLRREWIHRCPARDTSSVDAAWARALTERFNFNLDVNSSRVLYGDSGSFTTLTDYRYSSAAPSFAWNTSERTTLTVLGGVSPCTTPGRSHHKERQFQSRGGFQAPIQRTVEHEHQRGVLA